LRAQAEIDAGAERMPDVQVMLVVIALWGEAEELLKIPMTTLAECERYARLWNAQLPGVDASCVLVHRSVKLATSSP
jgi:hypothetical protein